MAVPLGEIPNEPGIYALYGGDGGARYVAYVGQAGKLRERLSQHLVRRDSSITTGASVVSLNPDLVRAVAWWTHERFAEPELLGAAELVAFEVLNPALRSRGRPTAKATALYADTQVVAKFNSLFQAAPSGQLVIETLPGLASRVAALEHRLEALEKLLPGNGP